MNGMDTSFTLLKYWETCRINGQIRMWCGFLSAQTKQFNNISKCNSLEIRTNMFQIQILFERFYNNELAGTLTFHLMSISIYWYPASLSRTNPSGA